MITSPDRGVDARAAEGDERLEVEVGRGEERERPLPERVGARRKAERRSRAHERPGPGRQQQRRQEHGHAASAPTKAVARRTCWYPASRPSPIPSRRVDGYGPVFFGRLPGGLKRGRARDYGPVPAPPPRFSNTNRW